MPHAREVQETNGFQRTADQQGEHQLPQADRRVDKILQQVDPLEPVSGEQCREEYDRTSNFAGRVISVVMILNYNEREITKEDQNQ